MIAGPSILSVLSGSTLVSSTRGCRALQVAAAWLALAASLRSQSIVLDTFNATGGSGAVRANTSWVGNVTQNTSTITVGGTARSENGWGVIGQSIDATGMNFVTIVAQRDPGHTAPAFVLQLEDLELDTLIIAVNASLFAVGTLTNVTLALPTLPVAFNLAQVTGWNLGGGTTGIGEFRMTFADLTLTAAVPSGTHSADSNRDSQISLFELTRVIEIFNTRHGTVRTGSYRTDLTGEDGFNPEPTRPTSEIPSLASYHSADSDRDGRIGLFELTRVIELFNTRRGTVRTGSYRVLGGTEDGFSPGP